jgi:tetratricopeptide (TPR) repeat protein
MYLNQKLAALSDAEQRMVCLSALPLWLDAEILTTLHGSREEADKALEILEKLLLLTRVSDKRYNIRSEEHRQLFRMAYARYLVDFEEANLSLARYFIELVEKTDDSSEQFSLGRSVIYHLLAVGEPAGREWLAYLFDDAEARGLTGVTRQLIQPLKRLRFLFSLEDRATLSVYRARAANLTGNYRYAERLLRTICSLKVSPILLAVSHRVLGQALADQQHWEEAIQELKKSLKILEPSGNSFSLALTWSSMGDLYQEMANFSGGIQPAKSQETDSPWVERLLASVFSECLSLMLISATKIGWWQD